MTRPSSQTITGVPVRRARSMTVVAARRKAASAFSVRVGSFASVVMILPSKTLPDRGEEIGFLDDTVTVLVSSNQHGGEPGGVVEPTGIATGRVEAEEVPQPRSEPTPHV